MQVMIYTIIYANIFQKWLSKLIFLCFSLEYVFVRVSYSHFSLSHLFYYQLAFISFVLVYHSHDFHRQQIYIKQQQTNRELSNFKAFIDKNVPQLICVIQLDSDDPAEVQSLFSNQQFRSQFKISQESSKHQLKDIFK